MFTTSFHFTLIVDDLFINNSYIFDKTSSFPVLY